MNEVFLGHVGHEKEEQRSNLLVIVHPIWNAAEYLPRRGAWLGVAGLILCNFMSFYILTEGFIDAGLPPLALGFKKNHDFLV